MPCVCDKGQGFFHRAMQVTILKELTGKIARTTGTKYPQEFKQNVTSSAEFSPGGVNHQRMVLEATRGYFHRNSTTRAPGQCTHSCSRFLLSVCIVVQSLNRDGRKCNVDDPETFHRCRTLPRSSSIVLARCARRYKAFNYDGCQLMSIIVVHAMAIWRTSRWQFV